LKDELQAIKEAVDVMDFDTARRLSDRYVMDNSAEYVEYQDKSIPEIVRAVEAFRDAGLDESQWRAEAWHLHRFEPQNIGGASQPRIRVPGNN
jgi:hypothetical protein